MYFRFGKDRFIDSDIRPPVRLNSRPKKQTTHTPGANSSSLHQIELSLRNNDKVTYQHEPPVANYHPPPVITTTERQPPNQKAGRTAHTQMTFI